MEIDAAGLCSKHNLFLSSNSYFFCVELEAETKVLLGRATLGMYGALLVRSRECALLARVESH